MTTRKGYLLNEVIIMLGVLALVILMIAKPLRMTIVDIPQMNRDFQANFTVSYMLRRLQSDIETAVSLPDGVGDLQSGDDILLIESGDGVISYRLSEDKVVREKVGLGEDIDMQNVYTWSVPRADITWKVSKSNGVGYAVEVTTSIKRKMSRGWQKKLKNSHVYFVGMRQVCSNGS
ncbi:MAG: hypothetical protein ACYS6I_04110 [Planctomycetota bacterium]